MVSQEWLVSYRDPAGAMQALERVSRRLSDGSGLLAAAAEVHSRYGEMESDFRRFFPALLAAFPAAGRAPIA
jgi:acyl carrier protein phosphodiesterase